jgi:hypothetical protein
MSAESNRLWGGSFLPLFRRNLHNPGGGAASRDVTLLVTHGLHAGAALDLAEPVYTVGSTTESDIVLRDSGIAPVHARLRRKGGQVEIEALSGDVTLASGEVVWKGHGRRCKLPVEVVFGEARILLTCPWQVSANLSAAGRSTLVAAGLVAAAFVLSIAYHGLSVAGPERSLQRARSGEESTRLPVAVGTQQFAETDVAQSGQVAAAQAPESAIEASKQLELRLAQAGIGSLSVEVSHGRLTVAGSIPAQQAEAWTDIQSWFDQTYGGHVPLISDIVTAGVEKTPRLPLKAIWYGQRPYIITADGARYYEGAFVNDGWTIKQIGEKELLLTKGGSTVALKYP